MTAVARTDSEIIIPVPRDELYFMEGSKKSRCAKVVSVKKEISNNEKKNFTLRELRMDNYLWILFFQRLKLCLLSEL